MKKIPLAVLSGLLVMFSFPTVLFGWHAPDLGALGWIALVPLFVAIIDQPPSRAYLLTFLSAVIWFGGSLYWIFRAVHVYGGIGAGLSVAITALLIVFLAAYVALAPAAARWISLYWRGELIVFMPVLWVTVEFARTHAPLGGFPWSSIAMSQWSSVVALQILDLVGIFGLMFAMVWVNWCIAELIARLRGMQVRWLGPKVMITVLLMLGLIGYGTYRLHTLERSLKFTDAVRVGVVQGNIPQEEKWSLRTARRNLDVYRKATRELYEAESDLIVWPEASLERQVSETVTSADPRVLGLPPDADGPLPAVMIGALVDARGDVAYNSALLFDAQGELLGRYDKTRLVPFGEYVPYRSVLFFARKLTSPIGDFNPGGVPIPLAFSKGVIGPLICYEDIFPSISRELTLRGATLLANITNDAWYGVSSAPYQHLALSVFRAVENRRPLIRSTNTGVSALIAPTGEVRMSSPLFERTLIVGAIAPVTTISWYTENGDWFAVACMMYAVLGLIIAAAMSRRMRRKEK